MKLTLFDYHSKFPSHSQTRRTWLAPPLLKHHKIQVFSATIKVLLAMNKAGSIQMNVSSIQESTNLHCELGAPHWRGQLASLYCTASMIISDCRGLLASLRNYVLASFLSARINLCISVSIFYICKSISPSLSKDKKRCCCCHCCCFSCCCSDNWDYVVSILGKAKKVEAFARIYGGSQKSYTDLV